MTGLAVIRADYANANHSAALVDLLDVYARDPMGGGAPLADETRCTLVSGLAATLSAFSVLAYLDGVPVGLANCFFGFSTFAAKPLVNIHDVVTTPECRGKGVGSALFAKVEEIAKDAGACKVTLEVLEGNAPAKSLYASLGYGDFMLDPEKGRAMFWQKGLAS
jgi:GNAT superfamily N-acetyltransferase